MSKMKQLGFSIAEGLWALLSPRYREARKLRRRQREHEQSLASVRRLGGKVFPIAGGLNIHLSHAAIADDDLQLLIPMINLKELRLLGTGISNKGMVHVAELTRLTMLDLRGTTIDDEGLTHLRALKSLETLDLEGTKVTDQGVENLRLALPNVHVVRTT